MSKSFNPDDISPPAGHYIGGHYVHAKGEIDVTRPSDSKIAAACPIADERLVDEAVQVAKRALKTSNWGGVRPRERTKILHRWADLIEAEAETLARLEASYSTRPIGQLVQGDIAVTAEQLRFFAEFADKEGGAVAPTDDASVGMIITEPYGVVGAITPWNFPINMAGWKIGPALAAGNAIVLKPSEMTPFSTLYMAELATRAGLPDGLLNIVLGDGATTGHAITGHPDIAKVSFTGSTAAGSAIMANVARTGIKPMTLELGGKSPQIVFADADLKKAAAAIISSILGNAGQACVAGSRLIVEESIAEEFTSAIIEHMKAVRPGPTWDAETQYSPIISRRQIDRIHMIVKAAVSEAGTCLLGGEMMNRSGYFYQPTLLADIDQSSPAITEEIFGPVLTMQSFTTEEEAISLADHPQYGLASGLYTRDVSRALRLSRLLQSGTVWVNRYNRSRDHILPTGGYKRSGIGKDLGREAYQANRKSKTVLIAL
ncbi:aldehyde dehydrogenase [Mesorhizobium sp. B3-1-7]|uniref:aldehyde dehydrogenase family protein n=1 Tax=Mesorhizobium sp. B3-1-7 TaxID=2589894 RepID=UPI001128FAFD|nr:aldehyde dehydrogenase family protein [Mesorhizobium sp. B3-1-7]TPI58175.1 aldehyde dehydrogenase [Mesorhizobium sp. B3-1-7]